MDLTQSKLTKEEWLSIEVPVSANEKRILKLIVDGYSDVNIRANDHQSMFSFVKIENTDETAYFLYKKYFEESVLYIISKYGKGSILETFSPFGSTIKSLKSADSIRIQNLEANIKQNRPLIFEFLLIDLCTELLKLFSKNNPEYAFYLYTLVQLKKSTIRHLNPCVVSFVNLVIQYTDNATLSSHIIANAYDFIEKNKYLLKYEDLSLFPHQKQLFSIFKQRNRDTDEHEDGDEVGAKLILYTAPTGTGKTLSPVGLATQYRVIFVCVARHIGLALAKSAISVEKKVAFAFGCETASDIRLHYFSAVNYTKHKKSGGIGKVDNSVGTNVEIMICDVQSYLTAMYYMLSFNDATNIITYWDEPTITMDYPDHILHQTIHRNWSENKIPNMVLSCATLPSEAEIQPVIDDFRDRFHGTETYTITSFDCKKSIPILNKDGKCVMPHMLYPEYQQTLTCVKYCEENKTLLRYFDLQEIIRFILYIHDSSTGIQIDPVYLVDSYFASGIKDITMNRVKEYYLEVLKHIQPDSWSSLFGYMISTQTQKYKRSAITKSKSMDVKSNGNALTRTLSVHDVARPLISSKTTASSGIMLTTSDAYTLTDGPTIFLAEDVGKIGNFYIQQSNISTTVFQHILLKISQNDDILAQIAMLEKQILAEQSARGGDEEKEMERMTKESISWMEDINRLRKMIRSVSLDPMYVPNKTPHQEIWAPRGHIHENAFVASIEESSAKQIMMLQIDNNLKVLLLLGIGVFMEKPDIKYMEIMKKLADEQRLFIIIASSDYIYGTNYQFCHGFIGKDLTHMTQQKTLQAMGRIGRNNIQQDYTIRFRDDDMIMKLFERQEMNQEAINMCKLFSGEPTTDFAAVKINHSIDI